MVNGRAGAGRRCCCRRGTCGRGHRTVHGRQCRSPDTDHVGFVHAATAAAAIAAATAALLVVLLLVAVAAASVTAVRILAVVGDAARCWRAVPPSMDLGRCGEKRSNQTKVPVNE